jgi:UDP-GlcNAc:undecaprenyl-phosphate GlcNAc-1-phosphate transferase
VATLDDRHGLGVTVRLLTETSAALLLWTADLGWSATGSEAVDLVLTVVWVLALVNALNLLDNLDGAAGSVGAAIGLGIGVMAAHRGDAGLAALCFALSGACLGFLRLNLTSPRARIFLGDGGSLAIGFGLAAAAMALPGQEPGLPILALALVGVPVLDTALVTVSRLRRGVTLLTGGRDHVTHRLLTRLGSPRRVALVLAAVQLGLVGLALWLAEYGTGGAVALGALYATGALACIAVLERPAWRSADWSSHPRASVRGDVATVRQR